MGNRGIGVGIVQGWAWMKIIANDILILSRVMVLEMEKTVRVQTRALAIVATRKSGMHCTFWSPFLTTPTSVFV